MVFFQDSLTGITLHPFIDEILFYQNIKNEGRWVCPHRKKYWGYKPSLLDIEVWNKKKNYPQFTRENSLLIWSQISTALRKKQKNDFENHWNCDENNLWCMNLHSTLILFNSSWCSLFCNALKIKKWNIN